jgi:hypothetical protein
VIKARPPANAEQLIAECKVLASHGARLDNILAPFLLLLHSYLLVVGVFTTYGAAGIIFSKWGFLAQDGESKDPVPGLMALSFALVVPVFVGAIKALGSVGSYVTARAAAAASALIDTVDNRHMCHASMVASRLRELCKFRPYDALMFPMPTMLACWVRCSHSWWSCCSFALAKPPPKGAKCHPRISNQNSHNYMKN